MLRNKGFIITLSLFLILISTIPSIAIEAPPLVNDLEITPYSMDCPNCGGWVSISREPRYYNERRTSDCRDCQRNYSHYSISEYTDITTRCGGTCGYKKTSSRLDSKYCNDNRK